MLFLTVQTPALPVTIYKVNGKTTRARDVQMLFADTVTGANSPALVSQGRVTAMINAKPQQRRLILEESAGVSGLYVRRHEAELRLRAADANLQRLEDLVGSMEGRLGALKKQARQAVRYKNLSTEIRDLEMSIAYLEWRLLVNKIEKAKAKFGEAESIVAEHMTTVTQLTKTQNSQAEELPALRKAEADASAKLQTQKLALQRIEDQERIIKDQLSEAKDQLEKLLVDRGHEETSEKENSEQLERLQKEEQELRNNEETQDERLEEKKAIKDELEAKVLKLEEEYEDFMAVVADNRAKRQSAEQQLKAAQSKLSVLNERQEKIQEDLEAAQNKFKDDNQQDDLKSQIVTLESDIKTQREAYNKARENLAAAESAVDAARTAHQEYTKQESEIATEIKTLETVLDSKTEDSFQPVLNDIEPEKGFETALSRALGDTLMGSVNDDAPIVWTNRTFNAADFPAFDNGVMVLEPHVKAPAHLKAALMLIGVVDSYDDGKRLSDTLKPGQSIVSKDGAYWRWDGLHIKAEAADRHALRLQQGNRLKELQADYPAIEAKAQTQSEALEKALQDKQNFQSEVDSLQSSVRESEKALADNQSTLSRITEERSSLFAEQAKLEEALANTKQDITETTELHGQLNAQMESFDEKTTQDQNEKVEQVRGTLGTVRDDLREAIRTLDSLAQEKSRRDARLHAIADENNNLKNRIIRSKERLKDLNQREVQTKSKIEALENAPKPSGDNHKELLDRISQLESDRGTHGDRLQTIENELADTSRALKEAEGKLSEAREVRAAAQATASAGQEQLNEIELGISEKFDKSPKTLLAESSLEIDEELDELPAIEPLKDKKEKMVRSRDMIGPVNLRAEVEAEELEKEVGTVLEERNDLIQAIAELREGIEKLNAEARERLMTAFDHVNGHFQRLFVQLYGGGSAHLALIESDDPLNSGLEIFAQPPGKTLQSLSLLSGGEQTLASIALIFGMFLTNPSPICVLDEIDAPLDDANVDRVCDLLDEIAERGETRFLVITHHRLTMARMDRLYGVTMAERGVSQLVSVDLNKQMDFLEAAE